jgi:cardiolipin synthase C
MSVRFQSARAIQGPLLPTVLGILLGAVCLIGCSSLPKREAEWSKRGTVNTTDTAWERALAPGAAIHPEMSGVQLLTHGLDALAARLALADTAERCLDVQYYIWQRDAAGQLLADRLLHAADRGVRVRLLLDDIGGSASDDTLLALDAHANIEVRLFNPVANRLFRRVSLLADFGRVNRRMHNKSFTTDRLVTILGGRNVGDRYFAAGNEPHFADCDVLAAGPAAAEVAAMFDRYWWSSSSVPIHALTKQRLSPERLAKDRATLTARLGEIASSPHFNGLAENTAGAVIRRRDPALSWGRTQLLFDLPEKVTTNPEDPATHLLPKLRGVVEGTTNELFIVSPYFVPGSGGLAFLRSLRQRGIRVVVLANSLASNDVLAVHAGYRRYRKDLLRAGVELYELKPTAHIRATAMDDSAASKAGENSPDASLHAKAFVFDRSTLFVGSLNLDPRSAALNTEMGLIVEIPELAGPLQSSVEERLNECCYRLEFVPGPGPRKAYGHIVWLTQANGRETRYTHEPLTSFPRRLLVCLLSLLPIESQL